MRYQWYPQGFIAILDSLVVLSVFMLVFGATTPMAQTGQDERCSEYTRQAKGLCTAAVSEGCFGGEESQECDDLAANWNERCRNCEGEPPWLGPATCPCADEVKEQLGLEPSANALYIKFLDEEIGDDPELFVSGCLVDNEEIRFTVVRQAGDDFRSLTLFVSAVGGPADRRCRYGLQGPSLTIFNSETQTNLSEAQIIACREDIQVVLTQLNEEFEACLQRG